MRAVECDAETVPLLAGDVWWRPEVESYAPVYNPGDGRLLARTPLCGAAEVERAVAAAVQAWPNWARTPAPARAARMFAFKSRLEAGFEELARLIVRENGKTLDEARGDVRRGIEVVDFACGAPHLLKGETLPQLAEHLDGATTREPIGVCVGVTPFNFPAMVPLWMFPLAIACGNTFVLKPSERVPLTAVRLAELALEAGFPPGVLNVVHGGRAAVDALLAHPDVAAVSFVGSTRTAEQVYAVGCRNGKRVQAAGGAKNVMVVMPDADPEATIRAIVGAAYGCAGQRCMAGSILMGVGEAARDVERRLVETIDGMRVADPSADDDVQMGPVIDPAARDRVIGYLVRGEQDGARLVRDGRRGAPEQGFFVRPSLVALEHPDHPLARDEIFGPLLTMLAPRSLDEAIDWANRSAFGNGAVIFTSDGGAARRFAREVRCGMIGVNVGVPAPTALFAFSGWNRSFFGDLHVQGAEGVAFFTRQKVVLSRWDDSYRRVQGW